MLSGRVAVVIAAPGASRIELINDVQPLARPGRAEQEDRVLNQRPYVLALRPAEQVADV
jgi:hypothetical protein